MASPSIGHNALLSLVIRYFFNPLILFYLYISENLCLRQNQLGWSGDGYFGGYVLFNFHVEKKVEFK